MGLSVIAVIVLPLGAWDSTTAAILYYFSLACLAVLGIPFAIFLLIGVLNWRDRVTRIG